MGAGAFLLWYFYGPTVENFRSPFIIALRDSDTTGKLILTFAEVPDPW